MTEEQIHHCKIIDGVTRAAENIASVALPQQMNNKKRKLLIYGATGYTGKIITSRAKALNLDFEIAGRSEDKIKGIPNIKEFFSLKLPATELSEIGYQSPRSA